MMMSSGFKSTKDGGPSSKSYFTNYDRAKSLGGTAAIGKRRSLISTYEGVPQTKKQMINIMNQTMLEGDIVLT